MHIAVASRDGRTISGHIGKCADWIVFAVEADADEKALRVAELERVTLPNLASVSSL